MEPGTQSTGKPVRCPATGCAVIFDLPPRLLGRSVECPSCGGRMTARPLEVAARLELQETKIHGSSGLAIPRLPFSVLVDNVRSLWNVGSIFRTADACGVREIALCGITGCPPRVQIAKTALGAERAVGWRYRADSGRALEELVTEGYTPVAVETSERAMPLDRIEWPTPLCLVLGSETAGVSPRVLDACQLHVAIPMRGAKDSLNVAVAFGIVAQHAACALERSESRPQPVRP